MARQRVSQRDLSRQQQRLAQSRRERSDASSARIDSSQVGPMILRGDQLLQLQRTAGNRAVARLADSAQIQRWVPDLRGVSRGLEGMSPSRGESRAKAQEIYYRQLLAQEKDPGKRGHLQYMLKMYEAYPSTHVAPIRVLTARVMRSRSLFPVPPLAVVKRGHKVTVLGSKGDYYRVRTSTGVEGWMFGGRLFPLAGIRLRSGGTTGGTTQGEAEFGARDTGIG